MIWKDIANCVRDYTTWQEMIQYPVEIKKKSKYGEIGKILYLTVRWSKGKVWKVGWKWKEWWYREEKWKAWWNRGKIKENDEIGGILKSRGITEKYGEMG